MSALSASKTAPPAISVVICAYTEDRWDDLVAAVASVRHQTVPPHEIVVVIDYNPALLARAGAALDGVMVVANRLKPQAVPISPSRPSELAMCWM